MCTRCSQTVEPPKKGKIERKLQLPLTSTEWQQIFDDIRNIDDFTEELSSTLLWVETLLLEKMRPVALVITRNPSVLHLSQKNGAAIARMAPRFLLRWADEVSVLDLRAKQFKRLAGMRPCYPPVELFVDSPSPGRSFLFLYY